MSNPKPAYFEAARLEFAQAIDAIGKKYVLTAAEKVLLLAATTASLVSPQVEREQRDLPSE